MTDHSRASFRRSNGRNRDLHDKKLRLLARMNIAERLRERNAETKASITRRTSYERTPGAYVFVRRENRRVDRLNEICIRVAKLAEKISRSRGRQGSRV